MFLENLEEGECHLQNYISESTSSESGQTASSQTATYKSVEILEGDQEIGQQCNNDSRILSR